MPNGVVGTDAMNRHAVAAALVAGLVLLAGCSSGLTGTPDGTATEESALDGETTAEEIEGETGTVNMYISDERNAIDDFEHLNVTVTRVGVKPAGDDSDDEDADADDTETENGGTGTENGGTEDDDTETAADTNATDAEGIEAPDADDGSDEGDESDDGESGWVEYEVDNRTVDLTELKGANATKLSSLDAPNGTYGKVFVYVSDVDGTLKHGSDQRVKLPSGKLQLNSEFTVGDGEEVDFVFDITAFKAGNSGKYVLKPVISESGTDVEIDDADAEEAGDREDDERGEHDRENELNASFEGTVTAGENVTLSVAQDGDSVEGATVFVDGERTGTTDANGTSVIQVPDDAEELEVEVTHGGAEAELEVELGSESDDEEPTDDESSADGNTTADDSQRRLTVG